MSDENVKPATDEQITLGAPNTMVHDRVLCAHSRCTPCFVASLKARHPAVGRRAMDSSNDYSLS